MTKVLAAAFLALTAIPATARAQADPPEAPRGDVVDTLHGERVADPYRWMEEMTSDRTLRWAREQDAYARRFVRRIADREAIGERIERIARVRRLTAPRAAGDRLFYLRFPAAGGPGTSPGTVLHVRPRGAPGGRADRVLIDPVAEGAPDDASLSRGIPSPDGTRVAYGITRGGSRWETIRIRDVESGTDSGDELVGVRRGSRVSWAPDGEGLYYERYPMPEPGERQREKLRDERLYHHRLGTSRSEDRLVFAHPDRPDWGIWHRVTDDGRYLVAGARDPETQHTTLSVMDLSAPDRGFQAIVEQPDARYSVVGNDGPVLWLYTDRDAPRGRVVAVDLRSPDRDAWRELIPEADETISSWILARGVGDRVIVGYLVDARTAVRVFGSDGGFLYEMDLPAEGSIWTGFVGDQRDPRAYYVLSSLVDPGSIYRLDVRTGRSELVVRPDLAYDPDRFTTRQVFYESPDGTRVPMFLVSAPETDRPAPVWMYGYGFGAWPAAPWFQPPMVAWLEMGGVWALPNTRGGGAYGEAWHRAGSRELKQNVIDDYVAATEWLIENGITAPELMVANGSSAGGPVAGAAIVQRPELYGAAILDYPVLDMLRYHRFTVAGSWRSEYGTAEDPEEFRALLDYSPVHNVEAGTCYPATLVAPGEKDEVTPPFHAYKFVAALQGAQGCEAPVLLRVSWGAGHSAGADLEASIATWADQLSFLVGILERDGWNPVDRTSRPLPEADSTR
ncbi:MAG: prolyl oligopeptidase family serine peptidase [Gemmatimonadota bacterium]|nr:prolyl oligopeptidase family serine peptidase [Gemmatimonadota bacterium]